jgi:type II secretory pathway pseudopilin PulG
MMHANNSNRKAEDGYILLTILLWVSLLSITAATSLTMLTYFHQQMKRDREQELVHRGVEYERAIRKYYRKFGSYPATIEMLEDSNHMRFLRKRYKDPITGKDFKVLHQMDVMMAFGNSVGGGGIAGAQTLGQPVGSLNSPATTPAPSNDTTGNNTSGNNTTSGDAAQTQTSSNQSSGTTMPFTTISGQTAGSQTMGGGGIAGVASISTDESIRVYNKKDHYNDWLFAYNPAADRGGLPRGPYDPSQALLNGQLGAQGLQNGLNGLNGANGANGTNQPFGQNGTGFAQGNNNMGQGMGTPGRR